ncbi:MAG TPA: GTPase, partial [Dehalococcoidia bacterium]|nr:GTPase [Dehalococcoidia bacterium]
MNLTIFGLPSAGKTTVFNALTRSSAATATYTSPDQPNRAVVKVPDDRVTRLAEMYRPKKTTPADVTYTDLAGFDRGFGRGEGPSGQLLQALSRSDALIAVVRAFPD